MQSDENEDVEIVDDYDTALTKNEQAISYLGSGQLLSCEYTVHPQWLADGGGECQDTWTQSVLTAQTNAESSASTDNMELVPEEVVIEEPAPIDFTNWCEIGSNCGDVILEQDIPASIEEEVVAYSDDTIGSINSKMSNVVTKNEVSRNSRSLLKQPNLIEIDSRRRLIKFRKTITVDRSLLKIHHQLRQVPTKSMQANTIADTKAVNKSVGLPVSVMPILEEKRAVKVKPKFRQSIKLNTTTVQRDAKLRELINNKNRKSQKKQHRTIKRLRTVQSPIEPVLINSGEIVKVEAISDNDFEIDIESEGDIIPNSVHRINSPLNKTKEICSPSSSDKEEKIINSIITPEDIKLENSSADRKEIECSSLLRMQLDSSDIPESEYIIVANEISELERYVFPEFFEGRLTKTPQRYLKIRNHILIMWQTHKPNYVIKSAVRPGLKNCGDVNCISRVHSLLEQIGAINFGCDNVEYIRPLSLFVTSISQVVKSKATTSLIPTRSASPILMPRQRQRARVKTESSVDDDDANYTVSHLDGVPMIIIPALKNNAIDEHEPNEIVAGRRKRNVKFTSPLQLVKCNRFSREFVAPFKVSISITTLLCLQLHSLSSKCEVMGMMGGYRDKSSERNHIVLARYKPCRTSEQSGTECEICPVSQVQQSIKLKEEGFELLGWFHSHPTFPPNPSLTDIQTQRDMQEQFGNRIDKPFIGFILGCLNMTTKCIYLLPTELHNNLNDSEVPYEFDVNLMEEDQIRENELNDVFESLELSGNELDELIKLFLPSASKLLSNSAMRLEQLGRIIKFKSVHK